MKSRYIVPTVTKYFISYTGDIEAGLSNLGVNYRFVRLSRNVGTLYTETQVNIRDLLQITQIDYIERDAPMVLLGERQENHVTGVSAVGEIGGLFFQNNPYNPLTGEGVLIAVIDTGIDYLHPDFIYEDGTSKIAYLWDQTVAGKAPEPFLFGAQYNNTDINQAIANNNSSLSQDTNGHGTLVAGIIGGRGRVNPQYVGVAPGSEFIVVKLSESNGYYSKVDLMASMYYSYFKASELGRPLVINISLGTNFNGVSGATLFENLLFYEDRGAVPVAAAGNEGNTQTHYSGTIMQGESRDILLEVGANERDIEIQFWGKRPDKTSVTIISPSGEISETSTVRDLASVTGVFDYELTSYEIFYKYPDYFSGDELAVITLRDVKPGIWTIRLSGDYIIDGHYDMYLPNRSLLQPGTKFSEADPFGTLNYPSSSNEMITVGTYNTVNNSIWQSSSRGPTRFEKLKPDIVAPGVNIISTYPGGGYGNITG
ncbi:MAG TPA: S8 family peptidase, partial [Peptostreptococcaceae bacterium]|nr:S8 family peptidase [Peptostreptococcaceae bacterium]